MLLAPVAVALCLLAAVARAVTPNSTLFRLTEYEQAVCLE